MSDDAGKSSILVVNEEQTKHALPFEKLIPALREAFAAGAEVPLRHHHYLPQPDGTTATVLLMPAWEKHPGYLGIKIVSIFPGNSRRNLPGLFSTYLLCDGETGRHLALIDGNQITSRRTVSVAALAASYLAREDASSLLLVGAGRIASLAAPALRAVRPITAVKIWNINHGKAETLAASLRDGGFQASAANSLEEAAREADIISCATLSTAPLIKADWLKPGAHVDLIGSFTPQMREADDKCFAAGRVYVDTMDALVESGDLIDPIRNGVLSKDTIAGTLADLSSGRRPGRRLNDEITIFKSVGTALSDITAGSLVYRSLRTSA